jgi:hypothetical protein
MSVQVYILIQTDVGKASGVAKAISQIAGVTCEGASCPRNHTYPHMSCDISLRHG